MEFTFDDWIPDLGAVLDAAGLDRFSLFGVFQARLLIALSSP